MWFVLHERNALRTQKGVAKQAFPECKRPWIVSEILLEIALQY